MGARSQRDVLSALPAIQNHSSAGKLRTESIAEDRRETREDADATRSMRLGADRVYVGDNDTTFVSVFTLDGKAVGSVKVSDKPTSVTGRELDRYHERMLALIGDNAQQKTAFERRWEGVPKPKRFPYWGSALVDRAGDLWVSDFSPPQTAPAGWSVFDRDGRRIAFRPILLAYQRRISSDRPNVTAPGSAACTARDALSASPSGT